MSARSPRPARQGARGLSKVHEPDAVGVSIEHALSQPHREPGPSGTAWARQCDQTGSPQQTAQLGQLPFAPDEGPQLGGEVVRVVTCGADDYAPGTAQTRL